MSTFSGFFNEFPFISADSFLPDNLKSKVFFLSHCHWDHMQGLDKCAGLPGPLYTSAVSKVLVRKQFPRIEIVRELEIECDEEICFEADGAEQRIVVRALPARHCPGSIMLLIQSKDYKVLYTGDFRLSKDDLHKNYTCLQDLSLDALYMDSTFLSKAYPEFPRQFESIRKICDLIAKWIAKSPRHKVIIETPAQYGSEFIFMEIGRKLKEKICFDDEQLKKYLYFPDMDNCISSNSKECRIICQRRGQQITLGNFEYLTIKPTALTWKNWRRGQRMYEEQGKTVRVVYSSHSSYTELKDFLEFVRAKKVHLNVIPRGKSRAIVESCLNEILDGCRDSDVEADRQVAQNVIKCSFNNIFRRPVYEPQERESVPLTMPIKRVKL